ncbi:unnamed protein product [marine sediment metagenome]|uniref:Uncharacterized protein n=1 Tax=marine sediment metagenome TaxID=412755 RepID=X1DKM4_9ZZZZ
MIEEKKDKGTFEKEIEPLIGDTPTVTIKGMSGSTKGLIPKVI